MPTMLQIPIFPLNMVLFPGGLLPLRIFEQRYLEMTKVCLRDNAPFGVCLIRDGQEVGAPATPASVGCTAVIIDWEMPHVGLFNLQTRGAAVFRILDRTVGPQGLVHANVDMLPESAGQPDEELAALCRRILQSIAERVGSEVFHAPLALDDPRWVSYRLAELLPIDLADRQSLLEERDDARRIARLAELLQTR